MQCGRRERDGGLMNIKDPRHDVPIWNSGCAALMCISFAALLAEACMVQLKAMPRAHGVCALLFLAQATAVYRGILPYRIGAPRMRGPGWRGRRITLADLATVLGLAGLGYVGSAWLSTSSAPAAAL